MAGLVDGVIDEVIDAAGIGSRWQELFGRRPLGGRAFDLVIDTQRRVLTTAIVHRIRHRRFISGAAGYALSHARPETRRPPRAMAHQLAQLVALARGGAAGEHGGVSLSPAVRALAAELLPGDACRVGFAPGAGMAVKRWPLDRHCALARAQAAMGRVPVFLLGPGEAALADAVRAEVPEALLPLQEAAAITPDLTIALGARLSAAVAADCGAGHLLAASGVPMVSLFGPTPPEKFAPFASRLTVIRAQSFGGAEMERIPLDAVQAALETLLAEASDRAAE